MSKLLGNLVKIALGAGAIYVAYKVGESNGKNKQQDVLDETKSKLETEIEFIEKLIQEYAELQNKTQKDLDNKELLEIKLDLLKRKL
jgi:hypothetical protein